MKIFQENSLIKEKLDISKDLFLLKFATCQKNIKIVPGQFINIKVNETLTPFLRRPFSIFDFDGKIITIIFKVRGSGTKILSEKNINSKVDIIFPLGNGFKKIFDIKEGIWFVAGGVGFAGLFYAFKKLNNTKNKFFIGFNKLTEANPIFNFLKNYNNINISVMEKQKKFFKGTVLELVKKNLKYEKPKIIAGCGPFEMLKELYKLAKENKIETEFLFEKIMGCGLGLCYSCAIKIYKNNQIKYLLTCKDGPVFSGDEIVWD